MKKYIFILIFWSFIFTSCSENKSTTTSNKEPPSIFSSRAAHYSTIWKNKIWVIGGFDSTKDKNNCITINTEYCTDVWSSENGADWIQETASANFTPLSNSNLLVYQNKLWLLGGYNFRNYNPTTYVFNSNDGINWNRIATDATDEIRNFTVVNNKILGFKNNSIFDTTNGIDWNETTTDSNFIIQTNEGQYSYTLSAFENLIYHNNIYWLFIINDPELYGRAFVTSDNLKNWKLNTDFERGFPFFNQQNNIVYNNQKFYIMGGAIVNRIPLRTIEIDENGNEFTLLTFSKMPTNQILYTNNILDGFNDVNLRNIFPSRTQHINIFFKEKYWIIGGLDENKEPLNDVWSWTGQENSDWVKVR